MEKRITFIVILCVSFLCVISLLSLQKSYKTNEKYASLNPIAEVSDRDIQININSKLQDPELKRLLSLEDGEVSRETIYEKYQNLSEEELSQFIEDNPPGPFTLVNNYNWANSKFIIDKEIVKLQNYVNPPNPKYPNLGKILNRSICLQKLRDVNNNPSSVFADITNSTIFVPSCGAVKTFSVDRIWNRITMMDRDLITSGNVIARSFHWDPNIQLFKRPQDIAYGTPWNASDRSRYPFYLPDAGRNFSYADEEPELLLMIFTLRNYSQMLKEDPDNYPFQIIFANIFDFPNTAPFPDNRIIFGLSNSINNTVVPGFNQYWENYSYVFVQNIRDYLPSSTYNRQSVLNQLASHELLHQIADVWDSNAHFIHEPDDFACVLRPPFYFRDNGYFEGNTRDTFEICSRHIDMLVDSLTDGFNRKSIQTHDLKAASNNSNSSTDIKLQMNLKKTKYLKFEPVVALFEYINLGDKADTIHEAFEDYLDVLKVQIVNIEDNTVYNHKNLLLHFTTSCMKNRIILPGDTLKIPMTLNAFGKPIKGKDYYYFGQFGYFPVGKYKAVATLKHDCSKVFDPPLISNEVYFEVGDISQDELSKIWAYPDVENKNYSEILRDFKRSYEIITQEEKEKGIANPFTEHLLRRYLGSLSAKNLRNSDPQIQQEIKKVYELFLRSFPDSFYTFKQSFIYMYLLNSNIDREGDDEFLLNKLKRFINDYPHLEVSRYLKGQIQRNKLPWKSE